MESYFTISEFAKLRNININSLRYYEKIGVLLPAYIDPSTKYRYYSAEQLLILDTILWCIDIGIPLKDLKQYQNNNKFMGQKLLEDGRRIAMQKMEDIKSGLEKLDYLLKCQELNHEYKTRKDIYMRDFPERHFLIKKWPDDLDNLQMLKNLNTSLFLYAEKKKMQPVSPCGVIILFEEHMPAILYIYCEILKNYNDECVFTIPIGRFLCKQIKTTGWLPVNHLIQLIQDEPEFPSGNFTAIVSNMILNEQVFGLNHTEIQISNQIIFENISDFA